MKPGAAIAIDHGERRTGFAACDPLGISVEPLAACRRPGDSAELLDHVAALLEERDVGTLVLGLPYNMDGTEGPRARAVRAFAERLRARFPAVEVALVDERLTSVQADEELREAGHRGPGARALRDSWAAAILLRDWLAQRERGEG